ncbi:796_t:CDS:2 [Acaulospora morrowiae]|uniref:796_t:CDS:1 n=1 Tax=Acaulospora morrowiae TaxID=94023 RepID=A0A9N8WFT7_9GLOM|nr:796_t:CDS:2 [Acaulospora morrowiae]
MSSNPSYAIEVDPQIEYESENEFALRHESTILEIKKNDGAKEEEEKDLRDLKVLDLFQSQHTRAPHIIKGKIAYFFYSVRAVKYVLTAVYLDWTIIIRHPVNFLLIIASLWGSTILLAMAGTLLTLQTLYRNNLFYGKKRIRYFRRKNPFNYILPLIFPELLPMDLNGYGLSEKDYVKYQIESGGYGDYKCCEKHDKKCLDWANCNKSYGCTKCDDSKKCDKCKDYDDYFENLKAGMKSLDHENGKVLNEKEIYNKIEILLFFANMVYRRKKGLLSLIHENINDLKKVHQIDSKESRNKVFKIVNNRIKDIKEIVEEFRKLEKPLNLFESEKIEPGVEPKQEDEFKEYFEKKINEGRIRLFFLSLFLNLSTYRCFPDWITESFIRKFFGEIDESEGENTYEGIMESIKDIIEYNERDINLELKNRIGSDLKFTSISELNTEDGGSFCGMFYSEEKNFIVVSFKGTSPSNFGEWIGNLTFQCVDARGFLYGQIHRGFYNYLFPLDAKRAVRCSQSYPSSRIIKAIRRKAKDIRINKFCEKFMPEFKKVFKHKANELSEGKFFVPEDEGFDKIFHDNFNKFIECYMNILEEKKDDDHKNKENFVKDFNENFKEFIRRCAEAQEIPESSHDQLIHNLCSMNMSEHIFDEFTSALKKTPKVNLWITGHSLGGGLATLFYARLLKVKLGKLKVDCELRDTVTFASPAVGDIHFAAGLTSLKNDPANEGRPLWRVVLKRDIVPKLPYRACSKGLRKYGFHYNVLMNYVQAGDKIVFKGESTFTSCTLGNNVTKEPYSERELFKPTDGVKTIVKTSIVRWWTPTHGW